MQQWLTHEAQSEDERRHMLAHELGVPFVTFERHDIDPDALMLIPEPLARAHNIVAFNRTEGGLEVALLDMASLEVLEPLRPRLPKLLPRFASEGSIRQGLVRYQQVLKDKFGSALGEVRHPVRLLRGLVSHALAAGAAVVHLDPAPDSLRVRYRIGGHLYDALTLPLIAHSGLAQALPASGSGMLDLGFADAAYLRAHTTPGTMGTKIAIHLARERAGSTTLEGLGLHGDALDYVHRSMARRRGLVLVTGASGKSTMLATLHSVVESAQAAVVVPRTTPELRAALKADPDIVVMDDAPDRESLKLLASAAARGIFAIAAADTALAGGAEPDLLITCAVVERLCTKQFHNTKRLTRTEGEAFEQYTTFAPVFTALKEEGVIAEGGTWRDVMFAHPVPCRECTHGYKGALGVYEVRDRGGVIGLTLPEDALFKAAQGLTSVEQALALVESLAPIEARQDMA